ncbi:MAG: hypothetical protein PUF72_06645 [Clostridiales bacterium]|nr:hypothetical protein [Clostridiales bacterium]
MLDIKKIVICAAAAVAVISLSGYLIYSKYIVPTYIEPVLETTANLLKDTDVQKAITDVAKELVDNGTLDKNTLKIYERNVSKYIDPQVPEAAPAREDEPSSEEETSDANTLVVSSSKSELGIVSVNTNPAVSGTAGQKLSDKFRENAEEEIDLEKVTYEMGQEDETVETGEEKNASELYNKIISVMSSHERSVFYSVVWRADINTLKSIYSSGDKAAAKEYLHSILSDSEYEEAVSIFFKYAYLLVE